MSLNTLNIKQKQGGRVIKQADRSSTFKFALQDSNGALINLNGQTANISLHNPNNGRYWETTVSVKNSEVEFKLPGNLANDDYILEIDVGGYVFPSDNEFVIEVVKGYKELLNKETAEVYRKSIEEITQDYVDQSDKKLKDNLNSISNKRLEIDRANAEILRNINDTGSKYIGDFNTNYQTKLTSINQKTNESITLIGVKKDSVLKEIDGQVKASTDKYLADYSKKLNDKVGKVAGKQLSDNNYSNEDKTKVNKLDDYFYSGINNVHDFKDLYGTDFKDTPENWQKMKAGYYFIRVGYIENQPFNYGFLIVMRISTDVGIFFVEHNGNRIACKFTNSKSAGSWKIIGGGNELGSLKNAAFESETLENNGIIYELEKVLENGQVKFNTKEIGKTIKNDFIKFKVNSDKINFKIKAESDGVVLFYSIADESLRYALHVSPYISDYEIDFGKVVNGDMIFTSVTMPEDKVSVIREEGL